MEYRYGLYILRYCLQIHVTVHMMGDIWFRRPTQPLGYSPPAGECGLARPSHGAHTGEHKLHIPSYLPCPSMYCSTWGFVCPRAISERTGARSTMTATASLFYMRDLAGPCPWPPDHSYRVVFVSLAALVMAFVAAQAIVASPRLCRCTLTTSSPYICGATLLDKLLLVYTV